MSEPILVAKTASGANVFLLPPMANRHGLVAGATGTGKTVTLQALAEGFSRAGVPVFAADVKGDLSGLSLAGGGNPKVDERLGLLGLSAGWDTTPCPVMLWDVFGEQGQPVRATVSEMGPLLLARMLELNDVQEGVLNVAFRTADENGLLLLDLKDLRAMLAYVEQHAADLQATYGNVSGASVGAIQRSLLTLEEQGGDRFFGEPALDLNDLMRTDLSGRGYISLLASNKLMQAPRVYATLLLWLLSELFEKLPEVGDVDKPRLVFFFDEAHLLFDDAPPSLLDKVEQVVRLIRSKGVGVYFVTQNPTDIPDDVLGQLGNKVQHALRAYTPKDQKAVAAMAETFRPNPAVDVASAVTELNVGEALISALDATGAPMPVERAWVVPPHGHIGAPAPEQLAALRAGVACREHLRHDRGPRERIRAACRPCAECRRRGGAHPAVGRGRRAGCAVREEERRREVLRQHDACRGGGCRRRAAGGVRHERDPLDGKRCGSRDHPRAAREHGRQQAPLASGHGARTSGLRFATERRDARASVAGPELRCHEEVLDLFARPRRLAKELQRRVDTRVALEAVDVDPPAEPVPAVLVHKFAQHRLKGHAMERVTGWHISHGLSAPSHSCWALGLADICPTARGTARRRAASGSPGTARRPAVRRR